MYNFLHTWADALPCTGGWYRQHHNIRLVSPLLTFTATVCIS